MRLFRHVGQWMLCALVAGCAAAPVSVLSPPPPVAQSVSGPAPAPTATAEPLVATPSTDEAPEVRIAAVGDIMLGGTAEPEMLKYGYDYPFERTQSVLQQAQIVFGNLEGPLTGGGATETPKKYVFRSPPDKVAPALARAGFNVVSLANNHSLDYGPQGLEDTRNALEKAGIRGIGAGRNLAEARTPVYIVKHGVTVAFLAYSLTFPEEFWAGPDKPGTAFGHEQDVRADVAAARQNADLVVVSFHWGQEGKTELRDYQVQLAHAAIDAGASAVLGHHPHILQAVERYQNGIILYSLGNFAFGSYSNTATRSVVALLTFRNRQWTELRLLPINVRNAEVVFQPRPLSGQDAAEVVETLKQLSLARQTALENRDGVALLTAANK